MRWLLQQVFGAFGYKISKNRSALEANLNLDEHLGYDLETEAVESILLVKDHTMLSKKRLVTLYQQVVYCERGEIPGAFVECGVWKGGAVGLMALANMNAGMHRRDIHLFDSFQDICEPDSRIDGARALADVKQYYGKAGREQGRLVPLEGFYRSFGGPGSLDENKRLLEQKIGYDKSFLHYHAGWFQDTVPEAARHIDKIALLRLDGDWYASTKICLEFLYDLVVTGGIIIVDDYGTYEGCKKATDEFISHRNIKVYLGHVDKDCRYFIKP